ncbi:hypothetical protein ACGFZL_21195 [Streptomyces sp. NPDC048182]|uniref:hypothetical protein n=1 Tax=Streptomyces sp. NPDC048182 TaxID=3365507 RepID=UPI00371329F1
MTGRFSGVRVVSGVGAGLVLVLLLLVVVRLPWIGDLGMHAATLERLRHSLTDPGNPLVDADTPSPYYSPWTVLLGCLARVSGWSVFVVLRVGAVVALGVLGSGVWRWVRTLSGRAVAVPLVFLCLVLLWGWVPFDWSGLLGLESLALTVAYPSVLALGLAFHLWAWVGRAVRGPVGWGAGVGLGVLWAVVLLCHQFSGVVASLGALAVVVAGRPGGRVLARLGVGVLVGVGVLWVWPYYDFFALFGAGGALEAVHRPLYAGLGARLWLVGVVGVVALVVRGRRVGFGRDPLVVFFVLGVLVFAAGGVTGHWSWGRVLPAVVIPAQVAVGVEVAEAAAVGRRVWVAGVALALVVGAWAQVGAVGFVVGRGVLPRWVEAKYREPWEGYHWITRWVGYGDVVMARRVPSREIPAYGAYTVVPGYPDFFLADEGAREGAVRAYFARGAGGGVRRGILEEYGVRWVVDRGSGLRGVAGLREVGRGPRGEVLYAVVR